MRWPLQPLQPLQQTQLQPLFGQSVDSLCHPWFTTTNVSYRFPILKLPPPPCAVLLVTMIIAMTMKRIELIHITVTIHTCVHSNIVLFATAVSVGFQSLGLGVVLGVLGETRTAPTLEPAVGLQSLVKTLFWSIILLSLLLLLLLLFYRFCYNYDYFLHCFY